AAFDALAPSVAKGVIFAGDGSNVVAFSPGNNGEILSYDSSEPTGLKAISALVNPMTNEHDMIVGGTAGAATRMGLGTAGYVLGNFGSALAYGQITDASVDAAAAIAYSKLDLAGSIVDADIDAAAAIAYSKLDLAGSIVDADI